MRVQFDVESLAHMGVSAEQATVEVPDDIDSFTLEQRRAWGYRAIEQEVDAMWETLRLAYGRTGPMGRAERRQRDTVIRAALQQATGAAARELGKERARKEGAHREQFDPRTGMSEPRVTRRG